MICDDCKRWEESCVEVEPQVNLCKECIAEREEECKK